MSYDIQGNTGQIRTKHDTEQVELLLSVYLKEIAQCARESELLLWDNHSLCRVVLFELFDALSSRHPSVNHELVLRNKAHRIAVWDSFPQAAARRELAGAVEMLLAAVAADDAHLKGIRGSGCYFGDLYGLGGH